jgi:PAS domain S-box-containing protein
LQRVFEQAPVAIFVLHGPTHLMQVVNPGMSELLGLPVHKLLGKPFAEAIPELTTQGYPKLLAQVWRTGQSVTMQESPARLARHPPGEIGYFTFVYQPIFEVAGHFTDIMCVALDVTEQVRARQQVQDLNEELAAINEELTASNDELH